MPLAVVNLFEIGIIGDILDALLQRDGTKTPISWGFDALLDSIQPILLPGKARGGA